jgi:hypothetical protein
MEGESSCHHCGARLQPDANYCRACGALRARVQTEPSPTPAAATQSPRPWLAVAAGISSLLLVAATVITLILTTGGGASVHSPTVVTVTTAGEAAAPSPQAQANRATHLSSSPVTTPAGSSPAPAQPSFAAYHGQRITAEVPAGWAIVENEARKTGYVESKWQSAADADDTVLIDFSPATDLTLEEDAAPVHKDLQAAAGYQEIYYGVGDLTGSASWMWLFRISGDERVDYFFNRCTLGFGVLGSTRSSRFAGMRATFRAVAQSVQAGC